MDTPAGLLSAFVLSGLLGMVGQGIRVVAGMKKLTDEAKSRPDDPAARFETSRLLISLLIGFLAGVVAAFSLGLSKLVSLKGDDVQLLLGIMAAGYAGADFIEAFARTALPKGAPAPTPPAEAGNATGGAAASGGGAVAPAKPAATPNTKPSTGLPSDTLASGQVQALVGRMSTFGGPNDKGVAADEGLALIGDGDIGKFSDLFLAEQPAGTTGLARRLDPNAAYIACRWDYSVTSRTYLRSIRVEVTNPSNGRSALAQPVDWGPNTKTGRVADLSPGIAEQLGLDTDDTCRVLIPLPSGASVGDPAGPAPSAVPHVLNIAEIRKAFGDFEFQEKPGGRIAILGDWRDKHIVTVALPQIAGLLGGEKIECHRAIAGPLQGAFEEIAEAGLIDRILTWDGCFVPRHKGWDPDRELSAHSWGIAFDINANWNAYGEDPKPKGMKGSVIELVPFFERRGFAWGGRFSTKYRDGMHFEYCRTSAG